MWFASLKIDDAAFHGPIPSVLVSAHDDGDDNKMESEEEKPSSLTNQSQHVTVCQETTLSEMAACQGHQDQWEPTDPKEEPVKLEVLPTEEEVKAQVNSSEGAGLMNGGHLERENVSSHGLGVCMYVPMTVLCLCRRCLI